jgi:hypothetical protein
VVVVLNLPCDGREEGVIVTNPPSLAHIVHWCM